jgi:hypothetical protein
LAGSINKKDMSPLSIDRTNLTLIGLLEQQFFNGLHKGGKQGAVAMGD